MLKDDFKVLGVMSGTSLDGVDIAYIHFYKNGNLWNFKILVADTIEYNSEWRDKFNRAFKFDKENLKKINLEYTFFLADLINKFILKNEINELDAICSHGHTILHQPENGITLQIGNLKELSTITGKTVVCDFRVQDVELGGQGAPLVPIGDELLFNNYDYCLNLGGFSNVSFNENKKRMAYDICPVNIVLNHYAQSLGFEFDKDGKLAQRGKVNNELLNLLNEITFYQASYPKSLGKEFIINKIFPTISQFSISNYDILRTFTEHIAIQISSKIKEKSTVLMTGGGAYNQFLIELLRLKKPSVNWIMPSDNLIQFKEALIFGLIGILRLRNEINVLASVTGASKDHSSGKIFYNNIL